MYFGGLRPAEAAGLREKDCHLPVSGWGLLTLEKTRPQIRRFQGRVPIPRTHRKPRRDLGKRDQGHLAYIP